MGADAVDLGRIIDNSAAVKTIIDFP